jgi:hypothetical protein
MGIGENWNLNAPNTYSNNFKCFEFSMIYILDQGKK